MSVFNVPNEFVPQSGQSISSQQMDENFDAIEDAIQALQAGSGGGSGTFTDVRKILYTQRPAYTGSAAPASNEFVDRKYLEATRGCRIGDWVFSINPNAPANDYGVVWAKMEGQQLSLTTYADFYTLCQSIGGSATGQYNPSLNATAGNFVAPDWRGGVPIQILAGSTALTVKVPNFVAANWLGSVMGESAHKQATNEIGSHFHGFATSVGTEPGNNRTIVGGAGTTNTNPNQADNVVEAMNVVQRSIVSLIWVRIK